MFDFLAVLQRCIRYNQIDIRIRLFIYFFATSIIAVNVDIVDYTESIKRPSRNYRHRLSKSGGSQTPPRNVFFFF